MRNRDRINKTCLYEFLMELNRRIIDNSESYCIVDLLTDEQQMDMCKKYKGDCSLCVEGYLNAEEGEQK
jgi:hypothetical protein